MAAGSYGNILKAFIDPIIANLNESEYTISKTTMSKAVNVIFFTEEKIFEKIGAKGDNRINVFITHGIADKNWRTAKATEKFNYVFVTGDAWKKKLIDNGMSKEKIYVGGYSRMDNIFNMKDTYKKQNNNGKKTILFAPTHNASVTTYGKLDNVINVLKQDYNVLISEHPYNKKNKKVTNNEFLEADIIVGDFGSSMYEGWALGKPSVLADWIMKNGIHQQYKGSFEDYIYQNGIGYHAMNEKHFIDLIHNASKNGITSTEINFIDGIFNKDLRGNSGKITAEMLREIRNKHFN